MSLIVRDVTLHGHRIRLREYVPPAEASIDDDVVVLIHGITGSGQTWEPLLHELARRGFPRRVLAPDLLGHGESARPRTDYGLGAFANGIRDLLLLEGYQHATLVGHSLGGGVAMQFSYQFPELAGRLALVDSGGLGTEVAPALRATALPGTFLTLSMVINRPTLALGRFAARLARGLGARASAETRELLRHVASLADRGRRRAFVWTARSVIDVRGQRGSARDRLYLAANLPMLIVWGGRDPVIPVRHGRWAAEQLPDSRLEIFENAKHFPHAGDPERFADVLEAFLDKTSPARLKNEELRALVLAGEPGTPH